MDETDELTAKLIAALQKDARALGGSNYEVGDALKSVQRVIYRLFFGLEPTKKRPSMAPSALRERMLFSRQSIENAVEDIKDADEGSPRDAIVASVFLMRNLALSLGLKEELRPVLDILERHERDLLLLDEGAVRPSLTPKKREAKRPSATKIQQEFRLRCVCAARAIEEMEVVRGTDRKFARDAAYRRVASRGRDAAKQVLGAEIRPVTVRKWNEETPSFSSDSNSLIGQYTDGLALAMIVGRLEEYLRGMLRSIDPANVGRILSSIRSDERPRHATTRSKSRTKPARR